MKSRSDSNKSPWLDISIDPRGMQYVRATNPSKLAWDGIGGTVRIAAKWTAEARASDYAPKANVLVIEHTVVSAILDELMAACRHFSKSDPQPFSVVLHGTPLELELSVRREEVEVRILEYVDYSDSKRTLGFVTLSRKDLCLIAAGLVENFVRELETANPSLAHESSFRRFRDEVSKLRQQTS